MFEVIQTKHQLENGKTTNRTIVQVFIIENKQEKNTFLKGEVDEVQVSENNTVVFDSMSRTAFISSKNGASKSISIGTYYFAIS